MVVMENNMDDSFGDSSFAIATAFRGSSDEDTRQVLNVMAQPSQVHTLKFYLVPCSWMAACLPFLMGQTEQRPTLEIKNSTLLNSGQVSDEEEEATNPQLYSRSVTSKAVTLRRDIKHGHDFYCVGTHVWNLISEKFGYDVELGFMVLSQQQGTLAVNLGTQKVQIPASGRFDYQPTITKPSDVVSDEEDDLFPGPSGLSSTLDPQSQDVTTSTTDIVFIPRQDELNTPEEMELEQKAPARSSTLKRKRYGSGLGNLGNTCFMNSTLQCLAHTEPLRRYFCSGEYIKDLNRENPLGTGGELATQFAELLCEMWGSREKCTTPDNGVVYPRSFKFTLGKHAEQFVGYDQHDSQELATYLLDALHEDTNRVTKKPYVEKPEQGEDEPDDVAASKSWSLHLQREDSKVLENFMGQVKSRVQCPTEGCGRVSTTFDPFMYLSVPIPGATDRTLKITFVPLEGRNYEMKITLPKTGTILTMQKKLIDEWQTIKGETIELKDLMAVDVWNGEVYSVYKGDDEIDKIRENDVTFVFQLTPSSKLTFREEETPFDPDEVLGDRGHVRPLQMTPDDERSFRVGEGWKNILNMYVRKTTLLSTLFNTRRGTTDGLLRFYSQLAKLNESLSEALDNADEMFQAQQGIDEVGAQDTLESLQIKALEEVSSSSTIFEEISEVKDVAQLQYAEKMLRQYIIDNGRNGVKYKDGLTIQVLFQRKETGLNMHRSTYKGFTYPLCLRVPGSMTVYELREVLARRLPFKSGNRHMANLKADDPTENDEDLSEVSLDPSFATNVGYNNDPGLLVMRQIPMTVSSESRTTYTYRSNSTSSNQLGMLERLDDSAYDGTPVHLADKENEEEKKALAEMMGQDGQVLLHWPSLLCSRFFDLDSYEHAELVTLSSPIAARQENKVITASKCIEKYCQMEQLEESEMWYCSRCKEHVRAWKQFHLYRTPPILIIHLKRFHYSASTHRRDKIDAFIDFPLRGLDLSSDVMHWSEEETPIYDCYAVSNHYGGLGGGHYTAYALNDDGTWCHYDDSRITTNIDQKEVISNAAYVLYYKRRDVVFETPEFEIPLPAIVHDHIEQASNDGSMGSSNWVQIDSMDVDARGGSSPSSNTSTSAMPDLSAHDDDDEGTYEYDSDHLPLANM